MKTKTEAFESIIKVRTNDIFSLTNDLSNFGFKYCGIHDSENYLSIEPVSTEIFSQQSKGIYEIKLLCKIDYSLHSTNIPDVLRMLSEYNEVCSTTEHKIISIIFLAVTKPKVIQQNEDIL